MRRASSSLLVAAVVAALGSSASAQLAVTYHDVTINGNVDFTFHGPAGTDYLAILSLTEGPTCFPPKHPVGCLDVDLVYLYYSFELDGFFDTIPSGGELTSAFTVPNDPTLDGLVVDLQMVSIPNLIFTEKSPLVKLVPGFGNAWSHSIDSMAGDSTGVPAIALDDGRVLLAGSEGANLDQCETYDVWLQHATTVASLNTGRAGHTVTKLQDGRVLVAGGADLNLAVLSSAEVYDPVADTWTVVGSMASVRAGHSANLLPDGRVLIAGGTTDVTDALSAALASLKTTELFDPVKNTFSNGPSLNRPHAAHTAVAVAGGDVILGGGGTFKKILGVPVPDLTNKAQRYQYSASSSGSWASEVNMKVTRVAPSGLLLADGRVLFAGGIGGSILAPSELSSAELYDPTKSTFATTGSMSLGRSGMGVVQLPYSGNVLVAGGETGVSVTTPMPTDVVEFWDPVAGTFTLGPNLPELREAMAAILLPTNHVALFGGAGGVVSAASLYRE
jgi:hypothetical protein